MLRLTAVSAQEMAQSFAAALTAAGQDRPGLVAGERFAIDVAITGPFADMQRTQSLVLAACWGALRVGIIPVMINPALPRQDRLAQLADCQPAAVATSTAELEYLLQIGSGLPSPELSGVPLGRPMHYTSGTTGQAKGVWSGVLSGDFAEHLWGEEQEQWQLDPSDLTLVHGPLAHSGPLRFAMLTLLAGGDVLLPGIFDADLIAQSMHEDKPTHAFVVPSHLQRLFALPSPLPSSPYRLLTHAGAACPERLKRAIHDWNGAARTWEFYGATEGQFSACSGEEWEQRPGTVGKARAGRTLRIDDGVIWCEAPRWASFEYWRDPTKTTAAWRDTSSGREFSVGDLGELDSDGYLYIDGRREDLIITGGVNVYPARIESVLSGCPRVNEVVVFGEPDARWGTAVCAVVVGDTNKADLLEFARQHLAKYEVPKSVYFVEDLPRTASGKVRRVELRDAFASGPLD